MEKIILGNKIILEKISTNKSSEFFELVDKERHRLSKFMGFHKKITNLDETENYIDEACEKWNKNSHFEFLILEKFTNKLAGVIAVHEISFENKRCEIGYWIGEEFEGKGFVSEALRLMESELKNLNFNRIEIKCSSDNGKSQAIPKKCAFALECVLKDFYCKENKFVDQIIFAKIL